MIGHIYGRINLLSETYRPNMFVNELNLYVDYLKKDVSSSIKKMDDKILRYFNKFKLQMEQGIIYYRAMFAETGNEYRTEIERQLAEAEKELNAIADVFLKPAGMAEIK